MAKGSGGAGRGRSKRKVSILFAGWNASETPEAFMRKHGIKGTLNEDWGEVVIPKSEIAAAADVIVDVDGKRIEMSGAVLKNGLFLPGSFNAAYFEDATKFSWMMDSYGGRSGVVAIPTKGMLQIVNKYGERRYSNSREILDVFITDRSYGWHYP